MRLAFAGVNEWRSRWVHLGGGSLIHRVRRVKDRRSWKRFPSGQGETLCGREGFVCMPGFLSRLGATRCAKCCKALGIPRGDGAPYNDPTLFPPEGRATTSPQPPGVAPKEST